MECPKLARIRDGAIVGCDMHQVRWVDNGEVFEVKPFTNDTRKLEAPYYGGKPYGNGALYVKVGDLVDENITNRMGMPKVTWVSPIVNREPERIGRMLASIRAIWLRFPDWRLGQLLVNAIPEFESRLFYTEDTLTEERLDKFEAKIDEGLDKFIKNMGQRNRE